MQLGSNFAICLHFAIRLQFFWEYMIKYAFIYRVNCMRTVLSGTIHIANAQSDAMIQVFDMNGKEVKSAVADADGNAEITAQKGVYVLTVGNQSTKVILQ